MLAMAKPSITFKTEHALTVMALLGGVAGGVIAFATVEETINSRIGLNTEQNAEGLLRQPWRNTEKTWGNLSNLKPRLLAG